MKWVYLPLAVLFILAILSLTGLGTGTLGTLGMDVDPASAKYYDSSGHAVVYVSNLTAVGEQGKVGSSGFPTNIATWDNGTFGLTFGLYYDTSGTLAKQVKYADLGKTQNQLAMSEINLGTSLGFVGLIIGLMAIGLLVGARFLTYGQSEEGVSLILKATPYLAIWGVVSVLAMNLILLIPLFGPIVYLTLTVIFTLGVINSFGHPGND